MILKKWMRPTIEVGGQRELLYNAIGVYYLSEEQFGNTCQCHIYEHKKGRHQSVPRNGLSMSYKDSAAKMFTETWFVIVKN